MLARRVGRCVALGLAFLPAAGCGTSLRDRAARLDARNGTTVYSWLVEHEPSRLHVLGAAPQTIRTFDREARIEAAVRDIPTACRDARRDHALLLIFVRTSEPARRAAALDCGFALQRDAGALVVAPR